MSSSTLYRASGLALLVGAALFIIGYIPFDVLTTGMDPHQYLTPIWVVVTLVSLLGETLLLMGLPGIVPRVGRLGFAGFVLAFLGGLLFTGASVVSLLVFPWLAQAAPPLAASGPSAFLAFFIMAGVLLALGGILLSIACLRARLLPRFAAALMIAGVVLNFVGTLLPGILATIVAIVATVFIAVPFGWMGYALISTRSVEAVRPVPASAEITG